MHEVDLVSPKMVEEPKHCRWCDPSTVMSGNDNAASSCFKLMPQRTIQQRVDRHLYLRAGWLL